MTAPKLEAWPPRSELPAVAIHRVWEFRFTEAAALAERKLSREEQTSLDVPPEFYLDGLLRIDLHDDETIRAFVRDNGFLFGRIADIDRASLSAPITAIEGLLGPWPVMGLTDSGTRSELERARSALFMERLSAGVGFPFELLAETRLGLAWLRDLSRLAQAYNIARLQFPPTEWECASFGIPKPRDSQDAFAAFVTGINAGLKTFHPFITAPELVSDPAYATSLHMGAPPIYSVIVSQIYNHISEEVSYRICQNETCPRPYRRFVRQTKLDGSLADAPRSTAIYCSTTCKNAQTQRRKRKDKAKGAS